MRRLLQLLLAAAFYAVLPVRADDSIDRNAPDFVRAYVVTVGPGGALFSCAGHAFIRMKCPKFKLDYCFSYESEDVADRVLTFFSGRLKMGMFSVPTADYLRQYTGTGRSIRQYELNLPSSVKQDLWKILDGKASEGINLRYDYIGRGCAWSILTSLKEALRTVSVELAPWPEKYRHTRREIIGESISDYPWTRFAIHAIVGSDVDFGERTLEKVVLPTDVVEFLQGAKIGGVPILSVKPEEIQSQQAVSCCGWFTPTVMATLFVFIALVNLFLRGHFLDWTILSLHTLSGSFFTYLVLFSNLPATTWNWLLVPFNVLPILLWKWRQYWAIYFVLVLAVWELFMLCYPHQLTDPAYLVLTLGFLFFYLKVFFSCRKEFIHE